MSFLFHGRLLPSIAPYCYLFAAPALPAARRSLIRFAIRCPPTAITKPSAAHQLPILQTLNRWSHSTRSTALPPLRLHSSTAKPRSHGSHSHPATFQPPSPDLTVSAPTRSAALPLPGPTFSAAQRCPNRDPATTQPRPNRGPTTTQLRTAPAPNRGPNRAGRCKTQIFTAFILPCGIFSLHLQA